MKLYATVTSERATKGQGGNEYLKIEIQGEHQEELARIMVSPGNEPYMALYLAQKGVHEWAGHLKGKRQKGECEHERVRYAIGQDKCTKCGLLLKSV